MVSLLIPWILLLLILITVVLLLKKKWLLSAIVVIVIAVLNYWSDCFCFGLNGSETGDIKVLSYNIKGSGEYDEEKVTSIIGLIQKETPDILFLTENFQPLGDTLHEKLHKYYPYDTRSLPHNLIYSKTPLNNIVYYKTIGNGSSYVVKCGTNIKGTALMLFGCHLSSNNYSKGLNRLTPGKLHSLSDIKTYLSNMSDAFVQRETEADTIINSCEGEDSIIMMGDMNDVSGSPSMRKFSNAGFKDAWSEGGFGYGATIHHPLPYRIDHVLYNNGLKLKGIKKIEAKGVSDHDALVAVFDLE